MNDEKRLITSNNQSEQIMKQTYCIHVCLKSDCHLPKKFVLFAD